MTTNTTFTMKRISSALLLSLCLIAAGFQAEAKSPKRSNSKAKTTRTITVQKNQMGYADPTGHTYTASMEGIGMTMAFYKNKTMTLEIKGYYRTPQKTTALWEQSGSFIEMYNNDGEPIDSFEISEDGRRLYVTSPDGDGFELKIIR